ncbi:hypothetical protein GCM10023322_34500 [Rugosimonospora acidiphila]|uniref:PAP2 superfamily protein n=1 Tax=Rugosimonospora acidiphila TaxID=556531 RepID=A0ABP9RV43_9ACTN
MTEVLSPVPLVAAMELLLGWLGGSTHAAGLLFGGVTILITIAPPYAFVLHGVRRGRFTDRHLGDRRQRLIPLLMAMAATGIGIFILVRLGAPRLVLAGAGTVGLGLLVGAAINHFWKMSGHTAAAAAVLVICAEVGHGWSLLAVPVIALIGWSRVRLGDHTVAQVVVGAAVGALIAAVAMPILAG